MAMRNCPFCGKNIPEVVRYCTYCGNEVGSTAHSTNNGGYYSTPRPTNSGSGHNGNTSGKSPFKWIAILVTGILILIILMIIIASSGRNKSSNDSSSRNKQEQATIASVVTTTTTTPTTTAKTTTTSVTTTKQETTTEKVTEPKETKETKIEETKSPKANDNELVDNTNKVIFDDAGVKITYKGYTAEKLFSSAKIKLLVENTTQNDIYIKNSYINVNGYTFEESWLSEFYVKVSAGKKNTEEMTISSSQLQKNGIDRLGTVEIIFECYDDETSKKIFETTPVKIVFDKSISDGEDNSKYVKITESGGVIVWYKGMEKGSSFGDTKFDFLIENNSKKNVKIFIDDFSVNDYMMTGSISTECMAGKMANEYVSFYSSELDENEINKFETVSFDVKCYDADTYSWFTADKLWESLGIKLTFTDASTIDRKTGDLITRDSVDTKKANTSSQDDEDDPFESALDEWIDSWFDW